MFSYDVSMNTKSDVNTFITVITLTKGLSSYTIAIISYYFDQWT